jgi:hypothetical protein
MTTRNPLMDPVWFTPPDGSSRSLWKSKPSPPQQDPAVGQAAQANAEVSREALAFSKEQWEEGKERRDWEFETAKTSTDFALRSLEKQEGISDDYYKYLTDTFWPLEKDIVGQAQAYDTPERREEEAGRAAGEVRTQFGVTRAQSEREAGRYGVSPNQLNARYGVEMDAAEAAAAGKASNDARRTVEQIGFARKMDAASLGRNLPSSQATAAQIGLQSGNAATGNAMASGASSRADAALNLSGYGTAISGNTAAGNLLNSQYNANLQGWGVGQQAAAAQAAGTGQMVGTAAGIGIAAIAL